MMEYPYISFELTVLSCDKSCLYHTIEDRVTTIVMKPGSTRGLKCIETEVHLADFTLGPITVDGIDGEATMCTTNAEKLNFGNFFFVKSAYESYNIQPVIICRTHASVTFFINIP